MYLQCGALSPEREDKVIVSDPSKDRVKWGTNNANESTYIIFFVKNNVKTKNNPHLNAVIYATFTRKLC